MRSIVLALVVVLGISVNNIWAGNNSGGTSSSSNSSNVRYVKAPRFARQPLYNLVSFQIFLVGAGTIGVPTPNSFLTVLFI